jgi:hypothetical protein
MLLRKYAEIECKKYKNVCIFASSPGFITLDRIRTRRCYRTVIVSALIKRVRCIEMVGTTDTFH